MNQRTPQADGMIYLQLTKANTAYCDHDIVNEPKGQMAEGFNILICFALTRIWVIKQGCPADCFLNITEPFVHFSGLLFLYVSLPFINFLPLPTVLSSVFKPLEPWMTGVTNTRANRTACGVSPGALSPRTPMCPLIAITM